MELDQLRNVVKVAELGNFTRAAEVIGLSQSALSRSIARLEEELGQPIFERQSKQVSLTAAGERFQLKARQILAMVGEATAEIGDDGETGQIRVGVIPTIAPYFLPELLKSFGAKCPMAKVIIQEDTTDKMLKQVSDGVIDVAILARPLDAKYLTIEDLFEEELFLVMSPEHALSKKPQIRISDIESLPFVLLGEAHCLTDSVLTFCHQKAFHPRLRRASDTRTQQSAISVE